MWFTNGCVLVLLFLIGLLGLPYAHAETNPISQYAYGPCLIDTANRYRVSPLLLDAIIKTESDHNPLAINVNTNGSEDIGLMQINLDIWLPTISKHGYDRRSLFDPCTNIAVGGWVLAQEVQRFGYTWEAVGAYNAGPSPERELRRSGYARRVFDNLNR